MTSEHSSAARGAPPRINLDQMEPPDGYKPGRGHRRSRAATTRTAVHRGHRISIRTTYRIEIDGEPLDIHVSVLEDGSVHCHGLPNYAFSSALDMARSLIDAAALTAPVEDEIGLAAKGHGGEAEAKS